MIFDILREDPTEHVDDDLRRRSATPSGRSNHRAADGSGGFKVPEGLHANSWAGAAQLVLMAAVCRAATKCLLI